MILEMCLEVPSKKFTMDFSLSKITDVNTGFVCVIESTHNINIKITFNQPLNASGK